MKILIALTSFKGTLSAIEACRAAAEGARRARPDAKIFLLPVSDGGDGLLEALKSAGPRSRYRQVNLRVTGPLGDPVRSEYLLWKNKGRVAAVIESAQACGLALIPRGRENPALATSYGVGELIKDALRRRVRLIYVGLGGSATVEGGCGMAQALGAKLLDAQGRPIGLGNAWLASLASVDLGRLRRCLKGARFHALCDVRNPLLGARGAARVFGPQKGAGPEQVEALEKNLARFVGAMEKSTGRKFFYRAPGAGAAGGMGAGLAVFCNARLVPGVETVLDLINAAEAMRRADLVLVGEGCLDETTLSGKAPFGTAMLARRLGKRTAGIFGSAKGDAQRLARRMGLSSFVTASGEASKGDVLKRPGFYLSQAAQRLVKSL